MHSVSLDTEQLIVNLSLNNRNISLLKQLGINAMGFSTYLIPQSSLARGTKHLLFLPFQAATLPVSLLSSLSKKQRKPLISTSCSAYYYYSGLASSSRWKNRQRGDAYVREAKSQGLKSRAAFKLLEVGFLFYITMIFPY